VYDVGSEPDATRQYVALRNADSAVSVRTNDHPAGAVTAGLPRTSTDATNTSPTALAGVGTTNVVSEAFCPVAAPRNVIPNPLGGGFSGTAATASGDCAEEFPAASEADTV
jgi:hypothetical protein